MTVRDYSPNDLKRVLALFYHTVHQTNAKHYTPKQLDAWAPADMDAKAWQDRLTNCKTLTVWEGSVLVGFGNLEHAGALDCLYVHHEHQGKGVGTALLSALEQCAWEQGADRITADVSITARPFFLYHGYQEIRAQQVARRGAMLKNYVMSHTLGE